jgi:hypothetical protein
MYFLNHNSNKWPPLNSPLAKLRNIIYRYRHGR